MTRAEIVARIRARAEDIRALGAGTVYLFGSAARDEMRDDSDIDVFIDRRPDFDFGFRHLNGLQSLLEAELRHRVDVTTRGGIHPLLKSAIEKSAVRVL